MLPGLLQHRVRDPGEAHAAPQRLLQRRVRANLRHHAQHEVRHIVLLHLTVGAFLARLFPPTNVKLIPSNSNMELHT